MAAQNISCSKLEDEEESTYFLALSKTYKMFLINKWIEGHYGSIHHVR